MPTRVLGLLVLESDQTMEREFRQILGARNVDIFHARLANETVVTPETLAKMKNELPVAASLLPKYLNLNAIGYGCTSGATVIGEECVKEILEVLPSWRASTNPLTAAKAALKKLGVKRLALLTPYSPEVTKLMQSQLDIGGIEVTIVGSFYEENDVIVGQIDGRSIHDAIVALGKSDACDGVFVSCTSLNAVSLIEEAEAAIGKPVTTSNHALAWHLLRLSGIEDQIDHLGRLFRV